MRSWMSSKIHTITLFIILDIDPPPENNVLKACLYFLYSINMIYFHFRYYFLMNLVNIYMENKNP
ncbi:hypothetical protein GCM10007380_10460 [Gottfriedia solisilvae]|uniref:Uncharacterized protein n=1 Tax=Gottfriedia solisilvae TaxID=1516104 RepID=A0A8J3EWK4_9BACI|nr:hypothetical protein GCM10007380_10460 [Gottfriedia solisilvae]